MKRKHKQDGLAFDRIKVRCDGKQHTITVSPKGHLVHCNHDALQRRRERNLMEIGSSPIFRCTEAIRRFHAIVNEGDTGLAALPRSMRPTASRLRESRQEALATRLLEAAARCRPWWQRPEGLQRLLNHVLHRRLGVPEHVHAVVTSDFGFDEVALMSGGKTLFQGDIDRDWMASVYKTGWAVVGDALTLQLFPWGSEHTASQCRPVRWPDGSIAFVRQTTRIVVREDRTVFELLAVGGT
jgi:hypothetical protein